MLPAGFKEQLENKTEELENQVEVERVTLKKRNSAWSRLIHKIYQVDPMICPKCRSAMKVVAVITDPKEIRKILKHLIKIGKSTPGVRIEDLED